MAQVHASRDMYQESDVPSSANEPLLSDLSVDHIEVISEIRPDGQNSTSFSGPAVSGRSWTSVENKCAPGHLLVQSIELNVLQDAVRHFGVGAKTLTWLTCPVVTAEENTVLPSISVFSEPEVTDELELVVHSNGEGTAQVSGPRQTSLRSQGSLKPSVATFDEVAIKRAGLYVIEIRCVRDPEISLVADHPTEIVPRIGSHSPNSDINLPEEVGLGKSQMWSAEL